jgi:hypothetical protein
MGRFFYLWVSGTCNMILYYTQDVTFMYMSVAKDVPFMYMSVAKRMYCFLRI